MYASSSPWTNFFQRKTRSLAPFSGFSFQVSPAASARGTLPPAPPTTMVAPTAVPAAVLMKSRRFCRFMIPPCLCAWIFETIPSASSALQPGTTHRIEEGSQLRIKPDRLPQLEVPTFAKDRRHLRTRDGTGDLGVGTGRLHHDHLGGQAPVAHREMIGPNPDDDCPPFPGGQVPGGQVQAGRQGHDHPEVVATDGPTQKIHGW